MDCLQLNLQLFSSCSEGRPPCVPRANRKPLALLSLVDGNSPHLPSRRRLYHRPGAIGGSPVIILSQVIPRTSDVDYSTFIPVSAALLFLYWIANFVVPELAMPKDSKPENEETFSSTSNVAEATNPLKSSNKRQGRQRRRSSRAR